MCIRDSLCPVCSGHCEPLARTNLNKNVLGSLVNKLFGKKSNPGQFQD
jgi:hypothetical protein